MQKITEKDTLIQKYKLSPHMEGGYYIRHYESSETIQRSNSTECKAGSAIYYLLEKNDISKTKTNTE